MVMRPRWGRRPRISLGLMPEDPVGSDPVDPGGIAYGSRGLSRSDVPPEFVHERETIPEGSQMDMRPRCGRRVAHVRFPGVFAALKPPATVCDPVGIRPRRPRRERTKVAGTVHRNDSVSRVFRKTTFGIENKACGRKKWVER